MGGGQGPQGAPGLSRADVLRYLRTRFRPHVDAAAAVGCFLCLVVSFDLAANHQVRLWLPELVGALTVVLLFFHLRLVDDLDDLDATASPVTRRRMRAGLGATELIVLVLNAAWPVAAAAALVAMVLALVAPFVVKPLTRASVPAIAPAYESAPLAVLAYGYVHWTAVTGQQAPLPAVLGVIAAFWAAFEFWKFSRKVGKDEFQPYGLADPPLRIVLLFALAVFAAGALVFGLRAHLSWFFLGYAVLIPAVFGIWLVCDWPNPRRPGTRAWQGMLLVETLIVAIGLQTLLTELGWS
jgi:hypothetical protein